MAAAFVKGTGEVSVDGGNSINFAFGSAPASTSNTIIGAVSTTQTLDASKFSDNQSGTYTIDKQANDGGVITVYVFRRTNALSTGSTVTVTISGGSGDFYSGCADEYSGVDVSGIISASSGSGTSSPFTATLGSTINSGDLAISVATADDNTSNQGISDPPTGGTSTWITRAAKQTTNTSASIVAAYLISAGGTESATTSCNTTDGRVGIIVGYKSAAGGGSATITPSVGSLTLTGNSAVRIAATFITPTVGALVLTGAAPNLTLTLPSPGSTAMTINGLAPTLVIGTIITPSAGSLVVGGNSPVVSQSGAAVIQPGTGSLTLSGIASTVITNTFRVPTAGALTLTGIAPTVVTIGSVTIQPLAGALVLSGTPAQLTNSLIPNVRSHRHGHGFGFR